MGRQLDRVHAALKEGPATSVELAAELELPVKQCCVALRVLWKAGAATRRVMRTGSETGRPAYLYTATGAPPPVRPTRYKRTGVITFPAPTADWGTPVAVVGFGRIGMKSIGPGEAVTFQPGALSITKE